MSHTVINLEKHHVIALDHLDTLMLLYNKLHLIVFQFLSKKKTKLI